MTLDPRRTQEIHEALDANLAPEHYQALQGALREEPEAAQTYEKLSSAEGVLRQAPTRAAPTALTQAIMARLAQPDALPKPQVRQSTAALAFGLAMTAIVGLLLVIPVSLAVIRWFGTETFISSIAMGVIGMSALIYSGLYSLLAGANMLFNAYPLLAGLSILIPLALAGLILLGNQFQRNAKP
ncbi:MAG: hypothetical protein ACOYL5_02995 [Phototrophicaceae bacterium]|jgi:anti-sigma factor RsiW